jgi:excisionase family DNA binding protein
MMTLGEGVSRRAIAVVQSAGDGIDRVITLDEAAAIAGVSSWTLKRENKRGALRFVRPSPRRVGIRRSELERWLDACSA